MAPRPASAARGGCTDAKRFRVCACRTPPACPLRVCLCASCVSYCGVPFCVAGDAARAFEERKRRSRCAHSCKWRRVARQLRAVWRRDSRGLAHELPQSSTIVYCNRVCARICARALGVRLATLRGGCYVAVRIGDDGGSEDGDADYGLDASLAASEAVSYRGVLAGRGALSRLGVGVTCAGRCQDSKFDRIVGVLETIIMDPSFRGQHEDFCRSNCSA